VAIYFALRVCSFPVFVLHFTYVKYLMCKIVSIINIHFIHAKLKCFAKYNAVWNLGVHNDGYLESVRFIGVFSKILRTQLCSKVW